MYPNLYYVFKDWFGVEWGGLSFLNTFGLMVAVAFLVAAIVLSSELKRKEKLGLLFPREETITVGQPASIADILINAFTGFVFGYKLVGLFFNKPPDVTAQEYIFSMEGNMIGGLLAAVVLGGFKWWDKNKQKLKTPEKRSVRIWPHDRVGDIIILGLIFGILGAKLFDNLEHWDDFINDPIGSIFSPSGLTFYGGLILATIAIAWYSVKKGISIRHLADSVAPALMIAYAVGRIGCQVSGDGDWGIFNSAYTSDEFGNTQAAKSGDYDKKIAKYSPYFLNGELLHSGGQPITDSAGRQQYVTDRTYSSPASIPHKSFRGPSFLPDWFFAYSYPNNVNKDGILIPGNKEEHNRVLPAPVFPTPLYETILCTILFLVLWSLRKRITTPLVISGLYLALNGTERFFIEKIRVNKTYPFLGFDSTQSEIIALGLIICGIFLIIYAKSRKVNPD
ncbi:MAG: prolipoprotein diacylglyceryl transferase family protein [Ferruginibacter sp.]